MADLRTRYMGLELANPVIVGSCGLTASVDTIRQCEDSGAGAVVIRSVFEDEVRAEYEGTVRNHMEAGYLEAYAYFDPDLKNLVAGKRYLTLIEEASKAVKIPVIASINCSAARSWGPYARRVEEAGARAIELNVFEMSASAVKSGEDLEQIYIDALRATKANVSVPVAVKMPPYFTNPSQMAFQLELEGASGLVMFNRPFQPDVDLENIKLRGGLTLTTPEDHKLALRWIGLLFGRVGSDLVAAGGVHDGETVIKQLLVGATAVQVVSALYRYTLGRIDEMLTTLNSWMHRHDFPNLHSFRGRLSHLHTEDGRLLEKTQYSGDDSRGT